MVNPLPKWLQLRYASLWREFNDDEFTFEQAKKLLGDSEETLNVVISEMKKAGFIEMSINSEDKRKRLYKLISPDEMIENLEKAEMYKR